MVGLTLPVANMLYNSFESTGGVEAMINAALESAKSIAIKEQRYAGIRFQKRYDPANPDPLNQSQYIIYIIKGENRLVTGNLNYDGFHAVDGIQPIKLPDSIGVMDMTLVQRSYIVGKGYIITEFSINSNGQINNNINLIDTTSFSIIFSPSGKLVLHRVRVRNRDGYTATAPSSYSDDDVFNRISQIEAGYGMFLQDDYFAAFQGTPQVPECGLGPEMSRNSFVIYDTRKFKQEYKKGTPYSGYLNQLKPVYVSPYSGTIIEEK
jgi:hypothetical protein